MHEIVEHYGKVIIALFAIVAALSIAFIVTKTISKSTQDSTSGLDTTYEKRANSAVTQGDDSGIRAESSKTDTK